VITYNTSKIQTPDPVPDPVPATQPQTEPSGDSAWINVASLSVIV
jgi:hypothetical protein